MSEKATQSVGDACEIQFIDEKKVKNVRKAMKSVAAVSALAETFKILGDSTRIKIAFGALRLRHRQSARRVAVSRIAFLASVAANEIG